MIVLTGSGIISSIGRDKSETLQSLLKGDGGLRPVKYLGTTHKDFVVGEVQESNAELLSSLGLTDATISRTTLLGIKALSEALSEARLSSSDLGRMALISGTTVGSMDHIEKIFTPDNASVTIGDCSTCTNEIGAYFGQFDYITTCSTACSSAANAFVVGANLIRSGRYDRVVVGGTECLSLLHFNGFRSLMIVDKEPCRPFDKSRVGLNLGEGAAFVVLETLESALARGVEPLAVLSGYGNACDAYHQTASSPQGDGATLSMQKALRMAGLEPSDIDYVNAHGTGTPNNDASECEALKRVFGPDSVPPFSSTKSMTGHTTSASGSIEMVICLLAMQGELLPANLNFSEASEGGLEPVRKVTRGQTLSHILCNSFGFGGNDTSLVLSRYEVGPELRVNRPKRSEYANRVYIREVARFSRIPAERMPKIPPMVLRRLSGVLRRALCTSLYLLDRVGVPNPDAIVTATSMGCAAETEAILTAMYNDGEDAMKPTLFMQSTHNTISSLVAINTHTHGYNNTFSHGPESLRGALYDAFIQLKLGDINNALVGEHDERGELSTAFFLSHEPWGGEEIKDEEDLLKICGDYSH